MSSRAVSKNTIQNQNAMKQLELKKIPLSTFVTVEYNILGQVHRQWAVESVTIMAD